MVFSASSNIVCDTWPRFSSIISSFRFLQLRPTKLQNVGHIYAHRIADRQTHNKVCSHNNLTSTYMHVNGETNTHKRAHARAMNVHGCTNEWGTQKCKHTDTQSGKQTKQTNNHTCTTMGNRYPWARGRTCGECARMHGRITHTHHVNQISDSTERGLMSDQMREHAYRQHTH